MAGTSEIRYVTRRERCQDGKGRDTRETPRDPSDRKLAILRTLESRIAPRGDAIHRYITPITPLHCKSELADIVEEKTKTAVYMEDFQALQRITETVEMLAWVQQRQECLEF